jgi:hypothetical protein
LGNIIHHMVTTCSDAADLKQGGTKMMPGYYCQILIVLVGFYIRASFINADSISMRILYRVNRT